MEPINYLALMPQLNPAQSLASGFALGSGIANARQERELKKIKLEDIERQKQKQLIFDAELQDALSNPTAPKFAALVAKNPSIREALKQSWDTLSDDKKQSEFNAGVQVFSALDNGDIETADAVLTERITAMKNSGMDTKALENIQKQMKANPKIAQGNIGLVLAAADPDRWSKIATEKRAMDKAPLELIQEQEKAKQAPIQTNKLQSEAEKAAVVAKFAESDAALDLKKKGWDITKIQNDIQVAKDNKKIALINAQISKEANEIKRNELLLKADDAQKARDEKLRGKIAEVENARFNIDNLLNTTERILKTPISVVKSATGPLSARLPTLSSDTADFEALIENLNSQAFLSQIPQMKGAGALSDAEGKKLASALQNFDLKQSDTKLLENVKEAQRLMTKARKNLAEKYGVPETQPDTPAATYDYSGQGAVPQNQNIEALLEKYRDK